jgi:hypothetical protein
MGRRALLAEAEAFEGEIEPVEPGLLNTSRELAPRSARPHVKSLLCLRPRKTPEFSCTPPGWSHTAHCGCGVMRSLLRCNDSLVGRSLPPETPAGAQRRPELSYRRADGLGSDSARLQCMAPHTESQPVLELCGRSVIRTRSDGFLGWQIGIVLPNRMAINAEGRKRSHIDGAAALRPATA